jgi:hypothetical protein
MLMQRIIALVVAAMVTGCGLGGDAVKTESWTLGNGIRVVLLPVPESTSVSIFTYLPMGLALDDAGKTQWSHLVEHMAIRSTHQPNSMEANAETLSDHMRLDFYGTTSNWKQGAGYHADWLRGLPYTQENLDREKVAANSECDTTAERFFTNKFAIAAWTQALRHGQSHASVKGDLEKAALADLQAYRDARLAVLDRAVVCIVGGVDRTAAEPVLVEKFGSIASTAKLPQPVTIDYTKMEVTWDLPTRHIVMTWPIPDSATADFAVLYAAAAMLNMEIHGDQELNRLVGGCLAGADLSTPEGTFFYINACCKPDGPLDDVVAAIERRFQSFLQGPSIAKLPEIAKQFAYQLQHVPDPEEVKKQYPAGTSTAMIEGNIGIQYGMAEFRFGPGQTKLVQNLESLTGESIRSALDSNLSSEKRHVLRILPSN